MRTRKSEFKTKQLLIASCAFLFSIITLNAQSNFQDGEKLIRLGQLKTAKAYFANKTNDALGCYYMGEVYYKLGNVDSATIFYQKGLELNPNEFKNNLGLAKLAQERGQLSEVLSNLNKATYNGKTKDVSMLVGAAEALINNKKPDIEKAQEYLDKAKELNSKYPFIYMVTGDIKALNNKWGDAANEYENAIFYDKNNAEPFYKVGVIYTKARNFKEAIRYFTSALAIDSNYTPAWRDLAEAQLKFAKYPEASASYGRFIRLTEPNYKDHNRYAFILFFNKEFAKSEEEAKIALQMEPTNIYAKRVVAYNQFENKIYDKALISIQEFFKSATPENIIAEDYEYYGRILNKNGQDSLAIVYFNKALAMDSTKEGLCENIASCYDKLKKPILASEAYIKLIKSKQEPLPTDYFALGKSFYFAAASFPEAKDSLMKKRYALKADSVFEKVSSLSPDSHLGYLWRARANQILDPETKSGMAKPFYEKTIAILETNQKARKDLMEAYQYMAVYLIKHDDINGSKVYWEKVLVIDPANVQAKETLDILNKKK